MNSPWVHEARRLFLVLLLAGLVGLLFDATAWFLLFGLIGFMVWHVYQLNHVLKWLQGKRGGYSVDNEGIYGTLFYYLQRMQKRNRRRKKSLTKMLNRFRESTAAMPDATVVLGPYGDIEWWNDAASNLLGLRQSQDIGQKLTNLIRHPDLVRFMNSGKFDEGVQIPSPVNNNIILRIRVVPYGNNQRLVLGRDITRIYQLEQMRSDFIANVSHELRTPLTVINGYLESLIDAKDQSLEPWLKTLNSMHQQSRRMQDIVSDLLLLSRLETEKDTQRGEAVDVPAMLYMIREDAQVLSAGEHNIKLEVDDGLWLRGRREELHSAFANLVNNAIKYTPEQGQITIQWYRDGLGLVWFAVRDTGLGIAAHHIPRLTERFYRVDVGRSRDHGGTGLGLAIVKHVLARHEADLLIESTPGKGSVFRCRFPAALALPAAKAGNQ